MAAKQTTVNLGNTDVKIVTPEIFDSDNIKYGEISSNAVGLKEMYLNYGDGNLYFQTPRMYAPYGLGINEIPEKDGKPAGKTYRLSLSFKGYDDPSNTMRDKLNAFHDMITELDDALIQKAKENPTWLKLKQKDASEDVIRALFNPSIKVSRDRETQEPDGKWPPTINCSLLSYNGRWDTEAYDQQKNPIDIESSVTKGCYVKCLVQAQKVTFPQGKFGIRYNILNMKVWPNRSTGGKTRGCLIQDDSEEEM